ncbi:deleted in lung and esophageal cancer protein 1 isoform X2 [Nothobranchius furzeri]|uniref:DLEC1 cilia and flagella associated protein n=1 Tax=Nothobranchius furzeri TaxID=105023 RepID=A0A8C6VW64_NOTFU|nr:transcript variant X2 [Nothobranchius furzeri]
MMDESDQIQPRLVDLSGNHTPASGKSQDISQILASVFPEMYTNDKDTLSNLVHTKARRISCHEDLQQALSEYELHIKEADMLKDHIIQASARSMDEERQLYEGMMKELGVSDHQGLLKGSVISTFSWYVDEELLRRNNLISPEDYLNTQKPQVRESAPVTLSFVKLTKACESCGDDDSLSPSSKEIVEKMNDLDDRLTCESDSDTPKKKRTPKEKQNQTKPKPKWMCEPSVEERERLRKLKDRNDYLRNPRFLPPNAREGGSSLIRAKVKNKRSTKVSEDQSDDPAPVFIAKPSVIVFTDYIVGHIYESTLELINTTSTSCHVRVIPPNTQYFSIGLGRFPSEGGIVAPGLSCKYTVRFAPDSLGDYEDLLVVETHGKHLLKVPIEARRPPPILTLPRVLDCGYCLVGGVKFVTFLCRNVGLSSGNFCIIPKEQWPARNLRSVSRKHFSEQPPFAVSPSLFMLQPGEDIFIELVFFPTAAERSSQTFTIVCDNCQVNDVSAEGEGQLVALELVSVSGEDEPLMVGERHDLTAEHFVRFSPCNPHSKQQKTLIIRNNVHVELPFHWQPMKPNVHPILPGEPPESSQIQFHPATDDAFHISPSTGLLAPCQDQEFLLTFSPTELKDYHSVLHLSLMDVPQLPPEPRQSSVLKPVQVGSKLISVTAMEIEVKGSAEPYQILLEPYAVIIPGEILICTTVRRHFTMWNHSKAPVSFQWERLQNDFHIIEVEPSAGRLEEKEFLDFDLVLTGGKPEKLETSLVCNIQKHNKPVVLAVKVTFKGPTVTLGDPIVDFGLVRLGEQTQTTVILTNTTQLEASWMLEEKLHQDHQDHPDPQISVEPRRGVLPPFASCDVVVVFRPLFCQHFHSELMLNVENGTGCHVGVRADVQSPQVCLLNRKLVVSDHYIGVPAKCSVTLFNQTLLSSHFSWMAELRGQQAHLCTAIFDPPSGTLGPNETMEITVHFTPHSDVELTKVAAVCEVRGMNSPLVLAIAASKPKKLSVSYSLPGLCPSQSDTDPSALTLDFGEDVVLSKAATKQLLITNQSAIPAPFTLEAEYFSCHVSEPDNQSEKGFIRMKDPLQVLTKKVEAKAHEAFVSSLLTHGKGAAFHVLPDSGLLGPFETRTVEVTAYTDMWGEYKDNLVCKVGDLEPVRLPVQMTVKGCPLYFQMTGPRAEHQHQGPILHFGTHVSGGDTVSRCHRVNNPTMFDIRLDWKTYNIDQNDGKLVDVVLSYGDHFPLKDADGNEVMSGALGLSDEDAWTHAPLSDVTNVEEEESGPPPAGKNLISVHIRPHLGSLSDYPYCITPQQIVIPARSSRIIRVSFTPLTLSGSDCESRCAGFALGFMSLDSKTAVCVPGRVRRVQGLDLEPIRLDLQAAVKPAVLLVQMDEDGGVLGFNASAGDLLRAESDGKLVACEFDVTQSFQLVNPAEMPLRFRLGTKAPFSVLKPLRGSSSDPYTGDGQALVIQPRHSTRVKVAFHCSLPLLDHKNQTEDHKSAGVQLVHTENGWKKLRFQQNLLIQFSNNTQQTVPLCADLDLPTLSLSTDSLNFGFCCVGETQTTELNLYSDRARTFWNSHTESGVFRVSPDSGLLGSKKLHTTTYNQCLQISFTPNENREFKAVVVFQSPLVTTPLTLLLQGTGSLDEN